MPETVIKVKNLSKCYNLGELHKQTDSFRERVTHTFKRLALYATRYGFYRRPGVERSSGEGFIWALRDISFEVKEGEVLGIIGRNGAGKSTLLKILSRITKPTKGKAWINGRVGSLLEVGTGFHPELTGRENIYLNGAILGMRRAEINKKFDEIVAFAEIDRFIDTPVKRYSSGMYVRLAFAIAAHLQQDILLVDEVLAVGDLAFQKKCLGKIGDVAKQGRTILFVSHQLFAIRTLCTETVWLDSGQIVKKGATLEVVKDYEEKVLKSSGRSFPVVERSARDTEGLSFYIQRIEMFNAKGEHSAVFSYNSSFILIIHLAGQCRTKDFGIEFRIYKDSGEYACTGVSSLFHDIYFDKGT
nr:ABC transporter ATP-binding protein [Desulfobacterales bacterium]